MKSADDCETRYNEQFSHFQIDKTQIQLQMCVYFPMTYLQVIPEATFLLIHQDLVVYYCCEYNIQLPTEEKRAAIV